MSGETGYIAALLSETQLANNERRQSAQDKLLELTKNQQFYKVLQEIIKSTQYSETIRITAGLLLKNSIMKSTITISPDLAQNMINDIFHLEEFNYHIAEIIYPDMIYALAKSQGPDYTYQILQKIHQTFLKNSNPDLMIIGFQALHSIYKNFEGPSIDGYMSDIFQTTLTILKNESNQDLRYNCLTILHELCEKNSVIISSCPVEILLIIIDCFKNSTENNIQMGISAINQIFFRNSQEILPIISQIVNLVVQILKSQMSENTLLLATELVRTILLEDLDENFIQNHIENILMSLVPHTVFNNEAVETIESHNSEDWNIPDSADSVLLKSNKNLEHSYNEDPYNEIFKKWNIRKSSAMTIDIIATKYGDCIAHQIFRAVEQLFSESHWRYHESANLLLGAISEGCSFSLKQHLSHLVPILFDFALKNSNYLVRSTTLWTLSRICGYFVSDEAMFLRYINVILKTLNDKNKRVQVASLMAMTNLQRLVSYEIIPHLPSIFKALNTSYEIYQSCSRILLYYYLETLINSLSSIPSYDDVFNDLFGKIIVKYSQFKEPDGEFLTITSLLNTSMLANLELLNSNLLNKCIMQCLELVMVELKKETFAIFAGNPSYNNSIEKSMITTFASSASIEFYNSSIIFIGYSLQNRRAEIPLERFSDLLYIIGLLNCSMSKSLIQLSTNFFYDILCYFDLNGTNFIEPSFQSLLLLITLPDEMLFENLFKTFYIFFKQYCRCINQQSLDFFIQHASNILLKDLEMNKFYITLTLSIIVENWSSFATNIIIETILHQMFEAIITLKDVESDAKEVNEFLKFLSVQRYINLNNLIPFLNLLSSMCFSMSSEEKQYFLDFIDSLPREILSKNSKALQLVNQIKLNSL